MAAVVSLFQVAVAPLNAKNSTLPTKKFVYYMKKPILLKIVFIYKSSKTNKKYSFGNKQKFGTLKEMLIVMFVY